MPHPGHGIVFEKHIPEALGVAWGKAGLEQDRPNRRFEPNLNVYADGVLASSVL